MATWEEMAVQVLVLGRPGDIKSAALGWSQLLTACDEVQTSLNQNITDLNENWKGAGYESFKTHIKKIAQDLDTMVKDARSGDGIVNALNNAADKLEQAQRDMPIPAECLGDLMAARNGSETIGPDFFHVTVHSGFLQSTPVQWVASGMDMVDDWLNNQTDAAREVYNRVDGQFHTQAGSTPGQTDGGLNLSTNNTTPTLTSPTGPGAGKLPGSGKMPGGGMPNTSNLGPGSGVGNIPDTGSMPNSNTGLPDSNLPGTGSFPGDGSGVDPSKLGGLAGAGGGFGGAGLGSSGLSGVGSGLGAGGLGAGGLPGGGALGKPTSLPSMGSMMGAGGLGAGRGGAGRASGGRGGAAGGHGAGHGGAEDERTTWLQEDEDPWGSSNGTPGVLR